MGLKLPREVPGCSGKVRHSTKRKAILARDKIYESGFCVGKPLIYKCQHCDSWHIGRDNRITMENKLPTAGEIIKYKDKDWLVMWVRDGKVFLSRMLEEEIVPLELL